MVNTEYQYLTDQSLLSLWKEGDYKAFDTLFKRYYNGLVRYASKSIPDRMLVEELVMDVMMRVWKKSGQIATPPGFKAYILRALKNAILNHFRSGIPPIVSIEEHNEDLKLQTNISADSKILQEEIKEKYLAAVSTLSDKKKEVFILSREENLSYKEIAQVLNISVNTVENYMSASLSHVREKLK